ncbi:hypothetical protein [Azospirillum argentinense]
MTDKTTINVMADGLSAARGRELTMDATDYADWTYGAELAIDARAVLARLHERGWELARRPSVQEAAPAGLLDFRPDLGASTPEPSLRQIVHGYYAAHFRDGGAAKHADEYLTALSAAPSVPAPVPEGVIADARFLLDRLTDLDFGQGMEDFVRDFSGHVDPAMARLRMSLSAAPTPTAQGMGWSKALEDIAAERRRQDAKWGGPEHDDEHEGGELAVAGAVYALEGVQGMYGRGAEAIIRDAADGLRRLSPCGHGVTERRRTFIKAAACITAEIERLDRSSTSAGEAV